MILGSVVNFHIREVDIPKKNANFQKKKEFEPR